jgi:putative transposase
VNRFRFVEDHRGVYGVKRLCRVLGVNRSGFYAWLRTRPAAAARAAAEDALAAEITGIHGDSGGTYGVLRVHQVLRRAGRRINRKKVERIMRERGIRGVARRRRRGLTKADTTAVPAPDLIGRDFTAPAPGTKLVGDITYLPTAEGWLYLASVLDLATREVIGYSMAGHLRADLVVDALVMAAGRTRLADGAIFHGDRGSQYTSAAFRAVLTELGMRQSMGRTGSCYDNAAAESFFATLKTEIGTSVWPTRAAARADVFRYIEIHYNRRRLHSTLGYLTPHEARRSYSPDTALAA